MSDIIRKFPTEKTNAYSGNYRADQVDKRIDLFPLRHEGDLIFTVYVMVGRSEPDICKQGLDRVAAV